MTSTSQPNQELTHVRADGSAHMVDVTEKSVTTRTALAEATVRTREDVIAMIFDADLPKGDALPVARVAGIMGAKRTPEIIPLCHPLPLGKITVDFERGTDFVRIEASVKTRGVTGVEMEALTAVSSAALTVFDMIKAVDKHAVITDIRVLEKSGGKSGDWSVREDKSGPIAVEWLRSRGFDTPDAVVIEDRDIVEYFNTLVAEGKKNGNLPTFILTSGGTGLNSDDQTVEAVRPHLDKEVPGIMHAFWMNGLKNVPAAVLSRGVAGVIDRTFVMTLPGSRGGVKDGVATLDPLVEHICRQMEDYHDH